MKKIGLCLAYSGTNYGQNLQAFATQQVVESYGFETEIIDYHSGHNKGIKPSYAALVVSGQKIADLVKKKTSGQKPDVSFDELHKKNDAIRKEKAEQFRKTKLHHFVHCEGIDELRNHSRQYYAVLVGSDQIWLPSVAVSNFYTLRFAAPGVRRISYATSLGVSSYPDYAKKPAAEFWNQIDFLSVREEQGKKIIQSIIDIPVEVVADPTYLLTKEQWVDLIPDKEIIKPGYVLCYLLGNDENVKKYCRRFADAHGLRLVSILSNECVSNDSEYCDEVLIGKGPEEFVNLIRHADYVMTDSFHGLAFSVINEKQFNIFYRKREDVKESRNSRIDNIVKTWGLESRLIKDPAAAPLDSGTIDYDAVNQKRTKFRRRSLDFLEKALGVSENK